MDKISETPELYTYNTENGCYVLLYVNMFNYLYVVLLLLYNFIFITSHHIHCFDEWLLHIDWSLTSVLHALNKTHGPLYSRLVHEQINNPEIMIIHQQRAVCVHLSASSLRPDSSPEPWNYSGSLNEDVPSVPWQSSCMLVLSASVSYACPYSTVLCPTKQW